MSFFPGGDPEPGDAFSCDAIEHLIIPSSRDIGGFSVRRALPTARRRMVGPFIFFDRMGPAILKGGDAMDVRPHPHIGLSTVTYLFDGAIRHRDSLGTEMVIRPGDVNLMTAGRGIVHSERTPDEMRGGEMAISGLQTWLALPDHLEEIDPVFSHIATTALPEITDHGTRARVVMGSFGGSVSPVPQHVGTLYVDLALEPSVSAPFDAQWEERAIYLLEGEIEIAGDRFGPDQLLVLRPGDAITITAGPIGARMMLFGGESIPTKRHIWWNFVSSSKERIEQAKAEWRTGRFDIVPGDEEEFIPLPA
ncbi:MAG: pirin family protein [Hoeflea sp.]|uniref:pirin family protein n=1 Tax=Hoeflea sp. TaxID=1940281 RepID=UPI001D2DFCC6|nr:pirin family protein [Hoeflea sp.]MBU4527714.1 pirin family protein [Alphaproteobacteria bacterium]MBU4546251.1 pirin family protein [Alphaproteobacteria bacterium]MBU4553064.1 pirin family protein [Alphaproteobacteria bacterium]MBV1724136.1 pirin family protein [Hoeflea sp.]MBV1759821.1 pirin family protein [Hoeflea sp.]